MFEMARSFTSDSYGLNIQLTRGTESCHLGMGQNLVPLVNLKIAGKWMFIPLKMVCIGIDPYPFTVIQRFIIQ